ncbi:MAG TPA: histidine kinase [Anaerolineales bacterium]|nr:histidine kinase [Anaerolineales bacterium]
MTRSRTTLTPSALAYKAATVSRRMNEPITLPLRDRLDRDAIPGQPGSGRQHLGRTGNPVQMYAATLATVKFENERLNRELRASRKAAQRFARKVVAVQEEERRRISRDLHDEAGQALTALKLNLASIRTHLDDPDRAGRQIDELVELTDRTMDQIRRLSHDLRPCVLDRYPLDVVLEGVCRDFAHRTGLEIDFETTVDQDRISDEARVSFYRFLQETLTNAAKHAGAHRIKVLFNERDGLYILSVSDDGCGFGGDGACVEGAGLTGMRERFELLGGWIEIRSITGRGVRLRAGVPPAEKEEAEG